MGSHTEFGRSESGSHVDEWNHDGHRVEGPIDRSDPHGCDGIITKQRQVVVVPALCRGAGCRQEHAVGMECQIGSENRVVRENVRNVGVMHKCGVDELVGQGDFPPKERTMM